MTTPTIDHATQLAADGHGRPERRAAPGDVLALCLPSRHGWVPLRAVVHTTEELACGCHQVFLRTDEHWPAELIALYGAERGTAISPHVLEPRASYGVARRAGSVLDDIVGVLEELWERTEGVSDVNRIRAVEAVLELVRQGVLHQVAAPKMAVVA